MKIKISVNNLPNALSEHIEGLEIVQTIDGEDRFTFSVKLDNEERLTVQELTGIMGEVIDIKLEGEATYAYRGVVEATAVDTQGTERWLTVSGVGLMGRLEGRSAHRAFGSTTVASIFNEIIGADYVSITDAAVNKTVTWAIQAGENDAAFLRRLAARHNVTCYYDGQKIVVRPLIQVLGDGFRVDVDKLDDFDAYLGCKANHKATGWDYRVANGGLQPTVAAHTSGNPLWEIASTASARRFKTVETYNPGLTRQSRLDARQTYEEGLVARATHYISARSVDDRLRLGEVVRLGLSPLIDGLNESRPYRIISLKHIYQAEGVYVNAFEAIPADLPMQADTPFFMAPQRFVAKVSSDADEQRLGRVTVSLSFAPGVSSPPIPVLRSQKLHDLPTPETLVFVECGGDDEDLLVTGTFYHADARNSWSSGAFGLYHERNGFTVSGGDVGVYASSILTLKSQGDTNIICSGNTIINSQVDTTIKGMGVLYLMP